MCKFIKRLIISAILLITLAHCTKPEKNTFSYNPAGYYYRLLAFSTDSFNYRPKYMLQLSATFKTQLDSVFWDSYNNFNDNFYVEMDSLAADNFIKRYSSTCAVGDSVCLLIKPADFFRQQFKSNKVPYFSRNDSVVKADIKIKRILSPGAFAAINLNLQQKEQAQIDDYCERCCDHDVIQDPLGFYWIEPRKEQGQGAALKPGNHVKLCYKGAFLNGRFLEASPPAFEIVYGTPDQLLKGLNYVINRIKVGQNAKIILPSRLAFGENGSTNGTVPPFTPLLYDIKITDVKE